MSLLLLATEPINGHPGVLENLAYQTVGIMVVLTSLGGLAICVALIGKVMAVAAKSASRPVPGTVPGALAANAGPAISSEIPPQELAVIVAAVHAVSGGTPAVIREIRPANPFVQAWSVEGRRQIFHSHTIR